MFVLYFILGSFFTILGITAKTENISSDIIVRFPMLLGGAILLIDGYHKYLVQVQ